MIEGLPTYWLVPWPIKLFKFYIYTSVILYALYIMSYRRNGEYVYLYVCIFSYVQ